MEEPSVLKLLLQVLVSHEAICPLESPQFKTPPVIKYSQSNDVALKYWGAMKKGGCFTTMQWILLVLRDLAYPRAYDFVQPGKSRVHLMLDPHGRQGCMGYRTPIWGRQTTDPTCPGSIEELGWGLLLGRLD